MGPLFEILRVQAGALVGFFVGVLFAALLRRSKLGERPRRWAGLVLAFAAMGAFVAQYGWPASPLGSGHLRAHERLFWMLPVWAVACLSASRLALVPLALALPFVARSSFGDWSLGASNLVLQLGLPLGLVCMLQVGDRVFRRRRGFEAALALGLVTSVAAAAIGATGSLTYAAWLGGLGTAWGLAVLGAWRHWDANRLDGATLAALTGGLVVLAASYSELEALDAIFLASALPLSLFVEGLVGSRTERARPRRYAAWAGLLLPLALVVLRLALAFEPDPYAAY